MSPKTLFWERVIVLFELCWWYLPTTGELYKTIKGYKAAEEDELTLQAGEMIEVIHKPLDGWWVVRYESTNFNFMVCHNSRNARSHLMIHNWITFPNVWKKNSHAGKETIQASTHPCSCAGREGRKRWMLRGMWSVEQHHHQEGTAKIKHHITITEHFGWSYFTKFRNM